MAGLFSLEQGEKLVKLARKSISYSTLYANSMLKEAAQKEFSEERGVFTTIHSFPSMDLRGCIGFPEPVMPLWNAVIESSFSAAFNDPRFEPLRAEELSEIIIELSILSVPEEIKIEKKEVPKKISVGRDGLIVRKGFCSGLLLPQVAPEWKWNSLEFLENTCNKAGLEKNAWKEKDCRILKFQAQIFRETKPEGKITEEK